MTLREVKKKMALLENVGFWAAVFFYISSFCLYLFGFVGRKEKPQSLGFGVLAGAFILHTGVVLGRWIRTGHPPVTDVYELSLIGAWFAILLFLVFERLGKAHRVILLFAVPVTFLVMGYGFMSWTEGAPMGPSFRSPWLIVHVIFAWLAFGCYLVATGAAVFLLIKNARPSSVSLQRIPSLPALDLASYRFIILGFINHAVMMVSGSIWAKALWGSYWAWDPLETWSLIAFLYYAFYLHARSFLKWRMNRAAWLAVLGLLFLAVSFWGVGWFAPSVHPEI
jgi:cytochrome c-type biogenesis protein CcsB